MLFLPRQAVRPAAATSTFYAYAGLSALFFALTATLLLVYQVQVVGLTPFQLVIVGTVLEATCFLFEIPTGVVADLYSRRLSIIIGAALMGIGFTLQGVSPTFWAAVLASVIWGVGYTFTSGATEAWITDEVGEAGVQRVFTRGKQISLAMTFAGIACAGALGFLDLSWPLTVSGGGYLLTAVLLIVVMPETGFTPAPRKRQKTFTHLGRALREGPSAARTRPVVRAFFLVSLLVGFSSEAVDRLWTAHVLKEFRLPSVLGVDDPAAWFAAFAMTGTAISLGVSLLANRMAAETINHLHPNRLLAGLTLVHVGGILVLALSGSLWLALGGLWVRESARSLAYPVEAAWLNRNVDSASRATVLSMNGQADAVGQVFGGPPLGALATRAGIPVALTVSALLLVPAAAVFARLRRSTVEAHAA